MILKRASRGTSKPSFTIGDDKFIIINEIQDNRACFSRRHLVDKILISGIDFSRTYLVSYHCILGGKLMVSAVVPTDPLSVKRIS